ncbi:LLM class flavin-dependent oxidoreductase, partial [Streptomyces sp. NPDC055078]
MRIAATLPYAGDVRTTVAQAVALEDAGLDIVYVPEVYGFDAPTVLGFLAARTRHVRIAPGILPIYSRTPAL